MCACSRACVLYRVPLTPPPVLRGGLSLSSAVTEHRRAVRPSRRSQGSRNPLRALAARADVNQDHMGDHGDPNGTPDESAAATAQKSESPSPPYAHAHTSDSRFRIDQVGGQTCSKGRGAFFCFLSVL